jgi:hypothetical protein
MVRKVLLAMVALAAVAVVVQGVPARGQSAGSLVAIDANGGSIFAVDGAGSIYSGEGCFGNLRPFVRIGQLPAGSTPTCMGAWNNGQAIFVGCSNGDVYSFAPFASPGFTASYCGNIFGGSPTPSQRETWGSLKSRYR